MIQMNNWRTYVNGNYVTHINLQDGTRIRKTESNEFVPKFAENMDVKICNRCDMTCKMCHEGSTKNGKLGNIMNQKFVETLHPYQELAIGGGNIFEHPDLIPFLAKLKEQKVISNITVHQNHFIKNIELIKYLIKEKLIYGIGVSLSDPTEEFINQIKQFPTAVIHVINGIVKPSDFEALQNHDLKILILGYKKLRRGKYWYNEDFENITVKKLWLHDNLPNLLDKFKVISFDNLALEQLNVKNLLSSEEWEQFYAGDDGNFTYYIDLVEEQFAKSSTAPMDERYNLMDSTDDMFDFIKTRRKSND